MYRKKTNCKNPNLANVWKLCIDAESADIFWNTAQLNQREMAIFSVWRSDIFFLPLAAANSDTQTVLVKTNTTQFTKICNVGVFAVCLFSELNSNFWTISLSKNNAAP